MDVGLDCASEAPGQQGEELSPAEVLNRVKRLTTRRVKRPDQSSGSTEHIDDIVRSAQEVNRCTVASAERASGPPAGLSDVGRTIRSAGR